MLGQGIILTAVGMLAVFCFLAILVLVIRFLDNVLNIILKPRGGEVAS